MIFKSTATNWVWKSWVTWVVHCNAGVQGAFVGLFRERLCTVFCRNLWCLVLHPEMNSWSSNSASMGYKSFSFAAIIFVFAILDEYYYNVDTVVIVLFRGISCGFVFAMGWHFSLVLYLQEYNFPAAGILWMLHYHTKIIFGVLGLFLEIRYFLIWYNKRILRSETI